MLDFWKGVFMDDTKSQGACAGQVYSFIALLAAIAWLCFEAYHTKQCPSPGTLAGASAWSTTHYLVHRGASVIKPTT